MAGKVDFERAHMLLQLSRELVGFPKYKWLMDAAAAELDSMEPERPAPEKVLTGVQEPAPSEAEAADQIRHPNQPTEGVVGPNDTVEPVMPVPGTVQAEQTRVGRPQPADTLAGPKFPTTPVNEAHRKRLEEEERLRKAEAEQDIRRI